MGAADIVPGVSGGTVALVLGHYKRLVTAISHIDPWALNQLREGNVASAWNHVDGRFLFALGIGILTGIAGLANLMHWLLEHRYPETMAVFFGLVLASGWVVAGMIQRWNGACVAALILSAIGAWAISSLTPVGGEPSILYLFCCATIAICAMILPGISGSFVLLLLGAYHPVIGMVKDAARLDFTLDMIFRLGVFAAGCAIGLAGFTRLLKFLLEKYANVTFAGLLGLMLGSLRKLWPLQVPTDATADLEFKERQWMVVSPDDWPGSIWWLVFLIIIAGAFVLALNRFATKPTPLPSDELNEQQ